MYMHSGMMGADGGDMYICTHICIRYTLSCRRIWWPSAAACRRWLCGPPLKSNGVAWPSVFIALHDRKERTEITERIGRKESERPPRRRTEFTLVNNRLSSLHVYASLGWRRARYMHMCDAHRLAERMHAAVRGTRACMRTTRYRAARTCALHCSTCNSTIYTYTLSKII